METSEGGDREEEGNDSEVLRVMRNQERGWPTWEKAGIGGREKMQASERGSGASLCQVIVSGLGAAATNYGGRAPGTVLGRPEICVVLAESRWICGWAGGLGLSFRTVISLSKGDERRGQSYRKGQARPG